MNEPMQNMTNTLKLDRLNALLPIVAAFAGKLLLAVVLWAVGRRLIVFATSLLRRALTIREIEVTVTKYLCSALAVVLNIALVVALLGYFGIETTSFAALFAAAGIAIGAAWSGLLAHFAAGIFLLIFRPFKVGDVINAGGVTGVVREIGLFATNIDQPDNVGVMVGNNRLFADNIINYSHNPWRYAIAKVEIDGSHDHHAVMKLMIDAARTVKNVVASPPPFVGFVELKAGPVLGVKVACHNDHYDQVSADLFQAVHEALAEHKIGGPVPAVRHVS